MCKCYKRRTYKNEYKTCVEAITIMQIFLETAFIEFQTRAFSIYVDLNSIFKEFAKFP